MPRLLFDENLSPNLCKRLSTTFAESRHVRQLGLCGAIDGEIWNRATSENFVLVSKDGDFQQRSFLQGAPPKVIWLSVGNASTDQIANLLEANKMNIEKFVENPIESLMVIRFRKNHA